MSHTNLNGISDVHCQEIKQQNTGARKLFKAAHSKHQELNKTRFLSFFLQAGFQFTPAKMLQLQPCLCLSMVFFFSSQSAYPVSSTKQNFSNAVISSEIVSPPTILTAPTVQRYSDNRSSSRSEDQARPIPPSSRRKVLEAALIAAAITLAIAGIIFFFFFCCRHLNNQRKSTLNNSFEEEAAVTGKGVRKVGKKMKRVIVNDNGRDIIYIKDSGGRKLKASFAKHTPNRRCGNEKKKVDGALERPRRNKHQEVLPHDQSDAIGRTTIPDLLLPSTQTPPTPSRSPMGVLALPSPPATAIPPPLYLSPLPPHPPPPPSLPPLPPAPPPLPTSMTGKKISTQPPLPSRAGGLVAAPKSPPAPRGKPITRSTAWSSGENLEETSVYNTELKPLYRDKVTTNTDHSVVWDLIKGGSLRFEDDMIETLFHCTNAGLRPPQKDGSSSRTSASTFTTTAQVFIFQPRRSQNTAIVLKSLAISRKEIIDAILEGHGLTTDILEKLVRISPTEEEKSKILQFTGNPNKLADAESFLFHILKAVPSAFICINAMLFRSNYYTEIFQLQECLQTLELGCKELRTRGLFLKLLEAILKASNKMNAGTSRGNALVFHLTALRKLSDVKSTDGKTTLLHFVVEQVVRSEGKRCMLNGEETVDGNNSKQRNGSFKSDTTAEERNKEYLLLGLPAAVKLSVEYANVKKAATIEYDNFINTCSSLTDRLAEIQQLLTSCGNGEEESAFVREMKGFLEELRVTKEEQERVWELVKRTTDYYQVGSSKCKGACQLQLFIIVKHFLLEMIDQACIDISKKLETKGIASSKGSLSQQPRPPSFRFPDFRLHLMSDMSGSTSFSDSDVDL